MKKEEEHMKMVKTKIALGMALLVSVSAEATVNVCYDNSCRLMATYPPQQMMNQLSEMFLSGSKELVFCEANSATKECEGKPISFSARSNLMQIDFQVPYAHISQVKSNGNSVQMVLDYQIKANQYYPSCVAPYSSLMLGMTWGGDLQLNSPFFKCHVTELGQTQMAFHFQMDYINLDTGELGGDYQVTVQGDLLGKAQGYTLLRLADQRELKMPRSVPMEYVSSNGRPVRVGSNGQIQDDFEPRKEKTIFDWGLDDWKAKWDSFKNKALKIIYLEPLND